MAILVGIAGGSGSGKTALAAGLAQALEPRTSVILSQDRYYLGLPKDEKGTLLAAETHNFDHPAALDWDRFAADVASLRRGEYTEVPEYCFVTHARVGSTHIAPADVLILEGTLILDCAQLGDQLDFAVFLDIDGGIRLARRLSRDIAERGRTPQSVLQQYLNVVRPMHEAFVAPSRFRANLILPDRPIDAWIAEVLAGLRASSLI